MPNIEQGQQQLKVTHYHLLKVSEEWGVVKMLYMNLFDPKETH